MKRTKQPARRSAATLLYYAPGGGLGHLTRAVAILRQWKRLTRRPSLLVTYSPFASLAAREGVAVKQIAGPEPQLLKRMLRRVAPKVLVVDTFPRGIVGEIADLVPALECPAVLVQRYLNPSYVLQFKVTAFVNQYYRLAVRIGDTLEPQTLSQRTVDVPPVTVREARELPLGAPRAGWLFVDWGEGSEPYAQAAVEAARQRGKELRVLRRGEYFPAVELMVKAELAIGSGGYNFFHEAALTGTPTIFVPCRRMYDDQFGRTAAAAHARTPGALRAMLEADPPLPLLPHNGEGAAAAVGVIQALLAGTEKPARGSKGGSRGESRRSGGKRPAARRGTGGARRGRRRR